MSESQFVRQYRPDLGRVETQAESNARRHAWRRGERTEYQKECSRQNGRLGGRPRKYATNAERQRAYRERHAAPVVVPTRVREMRGHIRDCYGLGCSVEGMAEILQTNRRAIKAMLEGLISP